MVTFTIAIGAWKPGIGDPSLMGWFTVYSYYFVALLCLFKVMFRKQAMKKSSRTFWIFLCLAMIVLGLQKQFNLLSAVTEMGRIIASHGGWIARRRTVQAWAMVAAVVLGLIISGMVYRRVSAICTGQNKMAVIGLVYLILFVVLRAISLHQFGKFLSYEISGARLNWIAELAGIYWIGLSVFWPHRSVDSR